MPIKWNAKRVKEATDMIEEALNKARDPLEEARIIAREALNIPSLPLYVGQNFMTLLGKIEDTIGGGKFSPEGWIERYVKRIRENIPTDALKSAEIAEKYGSQQPLV